MKWVVGLVTIILLSTELEVLLEFDSLPLLFTRERTSMQDGQRVAQLGHCMSYRIWVDGRLQLSVMVHQGVYPCSLALDCNCTSSAISWWAPLPYQLRVDQRLMKTTLLCLLPNTMHLLQPLDIGTFAPLKKAWKAILKSFKLRTKG